jgi:hypothetical protein
MATWQELKMDDVTQIHVGKHLTGIIGLKPALSEAAAGAKAWQMQSVGKIPKSRM